MNHDRATGGAAPAERPPQDALDSLLEQVWRDQDAACGQGLAASAPEDDDAFVLRVLRQLPSLRPAQTPAGSATCAHPPLEARVALSRLQRARRRHRLGFGLEAAGAATGTLVLALSLPAWPAATDLLRLGLPFALVTLALAAALLLPTRP